MVYPNRVQRHGALTFVSVFFLTWVWAGLVSAQTQVTGPAVQDREAERNKIKEIMACLENKETEVAERMLCQQDGIEHRSMIVRQAVLKSMFSGHNMISVDVSAADGAGEEELKKISGWVVNELKWKPDGLSVYVMGCCDLFSGSIAGDQFIMERKVKFHVENGSKDAKCVIRLRVNQDKTALEGPVTCEGLKKTFRGWLPLG